ncbi:MAG: hypothetical protein RRB13_08700 [bacterium]|nr:hypothetical protein [bacterium]
MKLLLTGLLAMGLTAPVSADMLGFYADAPVKQVFTSKDLSSDGNPSGYRAGVTRPFFFWLRV